MEIATLSLTQISDARYTIENLAGAIDTPLLPTRFKDERSFINEVLDIQLDRRFTQAGSEANLSLSIEDHRTILSYMSTSGTSVWIAIRRDDDQSVKSVDIEVNLPDDRAEPGRCHYESLTKALYPYWDNVLAHLPQPDWVECDRHWKDLKSEDCAKIDAHLLAIGFTRRDTPLGTIWESDIAAAAIDPQYSKTALCFWNLQGSWLRAFDRVDENLTKHAISALVERRADKVEVERRADKVELDEDEDEDNIPF